MKSTEFNKKSLKDRVFYLKDVIEGHEGENGIVMRVEDLEGLARKYRTDRIYLTTLIGVCSACIGVLVFLYKTGILKING